MPRIDVYSDLKPNELNAIGLAIYKVWAQFALGQRTLGGRRLRNPTGTYYSSLHTQVLGKGHVAVISDETIAPHGRILETGHGPIDMLEHLAPSHPYPIHRNRFVAIPGGTLKYAVNPRTGQRARTGSGLMRAGRFVPSMTGYVSTPASRAELQGRQNTSGRGPAWTIPAMPAYSPARLIAALFSAQVAKRGGTISYTR